MPVLVAQISEHPLDLAQHLDAVDAPEQGACATFVGTVRNHDPEAPGVVDHLDYSAHPSAADVLATLAADVTTQLDPEGVARVAVSHRVGRVSVGESAIIAAVSSPHRRLAFEVCEGLVERIKHELPVWKKQHTVDGDIVWSGLTG